MRYNGTIYSCRGERLDRAGKRTELTSGDFYNPARKRRCEERSDEAIQ